jgi:hypothetical protein
MVVRHIARWLRDEEARQQQPDRYGVVPGGRFAERTCANDGLTTR